MPGLKYEIESVWSSIPDLKEESPSEAGSAYLRMAQLYEKLDQHEPALQVCELADQSLPTQHPDRVEMYRIWEWAAFQHGDWHRAEELEASRKEEESRGIDEGETDTSSNSALGQ